MLRNVAFFCRFRTAYSLEKAASADDEQSRDVSEFLRLLSARLPAAAGVTGTTLVMWTLVLVLAVRLSVYVASFMAWQVKIRRVKKQFPEDEFDSVCRLIYIVFPVTVIHKIDTFIKIVRYYYYQ